MKLCVYINCFSPKIIIKKTRNPPTGITLIDTLVEVGNKLIIIAG